MALPGMQRPPALPRHDRGADPGQQPSAAADPQAGQSGFRSPHSHPCELYASEGRPLVPPEQHLLASLLQMFHGIPFERLLLEKLDDNG